MKNPTAERLWDFLCINIPFLGKDVEMSPFCSLQGGEFVGGKVYSVRVLHAKL
ncbi:hypothetical protein EI77_02783 [Prosthecobacter fusiformis]|uniref:Uncharacterized protein n=1 Tax=Prosthecobacter fusiformis TaxID=48464 RepID=A0A4R7S0P4_9BACT|nr:hypothetical protein EI77_02783 [Prosthecobacter fusiformis]